MRIKLFLLLMAICPFLMAQNPINQVNSKGKKQGYWKKYDDKNVLLYEGTFANDVPVGEFKYYYPNGKLKSTTNFIQGVHKVHTVMYDEQGKKAAEGNFIDQQKDSIWNYYNSAGTLIKTEGYNKGKKEGAWRTFSSQTGTLLEEDFYRGDKRNGTCRTFFADGKISTRIDYIDGQMNGVSETYYPGEQIFIRGMYHNGLKIKTWDTYDANGKIRKSQEFNNSRLQRTYLYLYAGNNSQKVNQDLIAYFHKEGTQTRIYTRNGKTFLSTETFETVISFLDFVDFCLINPSYAVAYPCIIKYRPLAEDTVEVVLSPATEEPVICQGDQAKQIKMLFNKEIPKE